MSEPSRSEAILVLNSGSSSLKFGLFAPGTSDEQLLLEGNAEGIGRSSGSLHIRTAAGEELVAQEHVFESQQQALVKLADAMHRHMPAPPVAVGHRVVHGGPHLREHRKITPDVLRQLQASVHFAPLHIPQALKLVQQAGQIFPQLPQFACFDTAFHATMPQVASQLPLPRHYFRDGVMRYGFHGLSCESVVYRLGATLPSRAVIAHLGNGSSVTAVKDGKSVDTSMGLTPTGGFPMSTRSGDLDPGVLLYLMRTEKLEADALEQLLNRHCGLAGFSGGESDMQALLERSDTGDVPAALAVDAFCIGVRKYVAAYASVMGGLDLLIFTGGIGEHSDVIRRRVCEGLSFLGLSLKEGTNDKVMALQAEEELQIARHCRALLKE